MAKSVNTFDANNWSNTEGPFELEFTPTEADQDIITLGADVVLAVVGTDLVLTDQVNSVSLPMPAGTDPVRAGVLYDATANVMQLMLDTTYSAEVPYDNSFGAGNIVVGADSREIMRHTETAIINQRQILEGNPVYVLTANNEAVLDDNGDPIFA